MDCKSIGLCVRFHVFMNFQVPFLHLIHFFVWMFLYFRELSSSLPPFNPLVCVDVFMPMQIAQVLLCTALYATAENYVQHEMYIIFSTPVFTFSHSSNNYTIAQSFQTNYHSLSKITVVVGNLKATAPLPTTHFFQLWMQFAVHSYTADKYTVNVNKCE